MKSRGGAASLLMGATPLSGGLLIVRPEVQWPLTQIPAD